MSQNNLAAFEKMREANINQKKSIERLTDQRTELIALLAEVFDTVPRTHFGKELGERVHDTLREAGYGV